jgi:flavin-dependent dehydrogenase
MGTPDFDVAIIGGGPAGTAAAISLLKYAGMRVIVLESSDYNIRVEGQVVSPGIIPLLDYLDVKVDFERDGHRSAYGISAAWGGKEIVSRDFIFSAEGQGWNLDRARFDRRLAETVSERGGLVVAGARVSWSNGPAGAWNVSFSRNGQPRREVVVRFVIDATGYKAAFARSCGSFRQVDDQLLAAVLVMSSSSGARMHHGLLLESVADGWWYRAALAEGREAVVFLSDPSTIRRLRIERLAGFLELMRKTVHVKQQLDDAKATNVPRVRPAYSSLLEPLGGSNWVAAGDAAVSFDPLASAGIGHALYSGIQAARVAWGQIMGRTGTFTSYAAGIIGTYQQYRRVRRSYYLDEQRWAQNPFWVLRHAIQT